MMSPRARIAVRIFAATLFSILAPAAVLYALGYRYDPNEQEVERIAFLLAESSPRQASVFLDDTFIASQTPARAHAVEPGTHTVRIEREDTFPWIKRLAFVGGLATRVHDITLFLTEPVKQTLYEQPITWSSQHTQHPFAIALNDKHQLIHVTPSRVQTLFEDPISDAQRLSITTHLTWHPTQPIAATLLNERTAILFTDDPTHTLIELPTDAIGVIPSPTVKQGLFFITPQHELMLTEVHHSPNATPTVIQHVQHVILTDQQLLVLADSTEPASPLEPETHTKYTDWLRVTHRDLPINRLSVEPLLEREWRAMPALVHIVETTDPSTDTPTISQGWFHQPAPHASTPESLTAYDGTFLYLDSPYTPEQRTEASHLSTYPPSESAHTFGFISGTATRAIAYNDLPTTFTYDKTNLPHTDAVPISLSVGVLQDINRLSQTARAVQWHPFATSLYTLYENKLVINEIDTRDGRETYTYDLDSFIPESVHLFLCDATGRCAIPTTHGIDQWTLYRP